MPRKHKICLQEDINLCFVVDDDVGVVRHDKVVSVGRLVHWVFPSLVLEDAVDHGVVGTRGWEGGVRHQGAVHAIPELLVRERRKGLKID